MSSGCVAPEMHACMPLQDQVNEGFFCIEGRLEPQGLTAWDLGCGLSVESAGRASLAEFDVETSIESPAHRKPDTTEDP